MQLKVVVTWCVIIAFFVLLIFLMFLFIYIKSTWQEKTIVGVIDGILAGTMYPLVSHYFPSKNKATDTEKKGIE